LINIVTVGLCACNVLFLEFVGMSVWS